GQIGGYDRFRRDADMMVPDDLYPYRKGATDSEALFLVALGEGLEQTPKAALERATARMESLSRAKGTVPHFRMTAAFSDGERLYAVRYASDDHAPTLYHRWSDTRGGRAVVSEPLEAGECWEAVPAGSFCTFEGDGVTIEPFLPKAEKERSRPNRPERS
ncbi:MAG: class II glutamine amidotransferase, partial [Rhodobacteraceae bacterium]|nr:class II glutamine amidotransferase [Paracoccaceae bacterium]